MFEENSLQLVSDMYIYIEHIYIYIYIYIYIILYIHYYIYIYLFIYLHKNNNIQLSNYCHTVLDRKDFKQISVLTENELIKITPVMLNIHYL